jgi:ribosomal protein S18 acetylase RimI-like enzyme
MPDFSIVPVIETQVSDQDLEALLKSAYIGGGYTDASLGEVLFRAANVKARGDVLVARDPAGILIGTVTLVLPGSQACRFAEGDEAELHLLCVSPSHRRQGVGHALVEATMTAARNARAKRMLLWTQPSMAAAQALYENHGFERIPALDFSREGRSFRVYARGI